MNYKETQMQLLHSRYARLQKLLDLNAPAPIVEKEGGMLIRAIIGAIGPGVLAEVAATLITNDKIVRGICPYHDDDVDRAIVSTGMCAGCVADLESTSCGKNAK